MPSKKEKHKIIKNKLELLKFAEILGNVTEASRVMGYSRDSFYRFKQMYETGVEEAHRNMCTRKPCPKNRVDQFIEEAVIAFELRKQMIYMSPEGMRSIWKRDDLPTFNSSPTQK
ncbi:MAG: helix-turn-helix domain-containing protein [Candidatus Neptunochlamydia sp.]|nr:helix-turn-helix domain-containing protein [Candidatus Neptunochlamydia sp.]